MKCFQAPKEGENKAPWLVLPIISSSGEHSLGLLMFGFLPLWPHGHVVFGAMSVLGGPHFICLHFTAFHGYWVFYKLKVCGSAAWNRPVCAVFPTAVPHIVSLSYFGNFCNISDFSIIICYDDLWSVILDATFAKKIRTHWRLRWWLALWSNKAFFTFFFVS